jgi:hypothetical protein
VVTVEHRFFVELGDVRGDQVAFDGFAAGHIARVLRLRLAEGSGGTDDARRGVRHAWL